MPPRQRTTDIPNNNCNININIKSYPPTHHPPKASSKLIKTNKNIRIININTITPLVLCLWSILFQAILFDQSYASATTPATTTSSLLQPNTNTNTRTTIATMANPMDDSFTTNMSNPQNSDDQPDKVCIIGSGNWGSAIATIVGRNCERLSFYETRVNMWVFEEMVQVNSQDSESPKRKLTEVINETHENVKYLPGIQLPTNVVAVADLAEACKDATLLIFVLPHQFLPRLLPTIREASHPSCRGVSLIKGIGAYRRYYVSNIAALHRCSSVLPFRPLPLTPSFLFCFL